MHRPAITFAAAALLVSVAACTTTVESSGPSGSSSGSSSGQTPGTTDPTGDGGTSTSTPPGEKPAESTSEGEVSISGTCPAFAACGGSPQGTYDYTEGCLVDVFADARESCNGLDTSKAKVAVSGSLYFVGSALSRKATVKISGSIVLPASCTSGQCATVETALKGSFDSVSCTGSSDCTCTITKTDKVDNATTFSVSGDTVTTGDGETYSICETGSTLRYSGKSAGSEDGFWSMKKR